jgi:hypothetical protein
MPDPIHFGGNGPLPARERRFFLRLAANPSPRLCSWIEDLSIVNLDYRYDESRFSFETPANLTLSTTAGTTYYIAIGDYEAAAILSIIHTPKNGDGGVATKAVLKRQIASLNRQLSKASHIQNDAKRAKKIKRLKKQISRLKKQLKQL